MVLYFSLGLPAGWGYSVCTTETGRPATCPINAVDLLTPGQSKETDAMSLAGTCGFHEHLTEGAPEFLGEILVGSGAAPGASPPAY